jgi:hypothetical protein
MTNDFMNSVGLVFAFSIFNYVIIQLLVEFNLDYDKAIALGGLIVSVYWVVLLNALIKGVKQ